MEHGYKKPCSFVYSKLYVSIRKMVDEFKKHLVALFACLVVILYP